MKMYVWAIMIVALVLAIYSAWYAFTRRALTVTKSPQTGSNQLTVVP